LGRCAVRAAETRHISENERRITIAGKLAGPVAAGGGKPGRRLA